MLDKFSIFTQTGLVLFEKDLTFTPAFLSSSSSTNLLDCSDPVGRLITDVLIEDKCSRPPFSTTLDKVTVAWTFDNSLGLVFVAVYQKILQLPYIERLLDQVKTEFSEVCRGIDGVRQGMPVLNEEIAGFPNAFIKILRACESGASIIPGGSADVKAADKDQTGKKRKDAKKSARKWHDKISSDDAKALDFSSTNGDSTNQPAENQVSDSLIDKSALEAIRKRKGQYEVPELLESKPSVPIKSRWSQLLESLGGKKDISAEDVENILKSVKEDLVRKNVAHGIADSVCASVKQKLIGKQLGTFETMRSVVNKGIEEALTKILTPSTSTDLLREIILKRQQKRPYSIAFIGVNGVGKSTNLSKVCFWLLQNKMSILIAACDTFRSGAVEQLRIHVRNLKVIDPEARLELYEKGYGKDAAVIAKDAIKYAHDNCIDVVLIDTAGRMQNNEPLMRSLSKLVALNTPDKVIFVGEALVGNEAIDQLTKFNQALRDFSGTPNPRQIDGMILTKFDTIDEKVGAAISMSHVTGKPIFFVGTGQTYTDLKRMNIKQIVEKILG